MCAYAILHPFFFTFGSSCARVRPFFHELVPAAVLPSFQVLHLQVARYLAKMHAQNRDEPRKPLPESLAYLRRPDLTSVDLESPMGIVNLFAQVRQSNKARTV